MNESESIDKGLRELVHNIRAAHSNPKKLNALLDIYEKDFGTEANENVLEIIAEQTREAWAEIALEQERNDIDGILDTLWRSFESAGGEFAVERSEDSAQIHCTKCPVADTYLAIGKPEYGLIFHCSTDPHIVAGFNPEMEFRITKKLMNGDACCDHYYRLK
jgi:predicted ArsR family transcriptional regulator